MKRIVGIVFLLFSSFVNAHAVPSVLNYAGQVTVNGEAFDGAGLFKFALVNTDGTTTYWSNDGTSVGGSEPQASVSVAVNGGLYSILLGNTAQQGMGAIDPAVFAQHTDAKLRVWFSDGVNGFQQLSPDRPFASVPYAFSAGSTIIAAGSINRSMLSGDIRSDLNRTITKSMLDPGVTLDLPPSLNAYLKPVVVEPLMDISELSGGTVILRIIVDGRGLSYEWRKNGNLLTNANSLQLQISDLNASQHNGIYSVRVSNAFGFIESNGTLSVLPAPPTLSLEGNQTFIIDEGNDFIDPGFSASDALGENLTSVVEVNSTVNSSVPGSYIVTYKVVDSSGKISQTNRTVVVKDRTPPVITILGQSIFDQRVNTPYTDAGAEAHDLVDGNVTSSITVFNPIDVNTTGTYEIKYRVADSAGNVAEAIRKVVVAEVPLDFALIPAGPFLMGKNQTGQPHSPAREVYVSAFYIGKYEVTKTKYEEVFTWSRQNGYSYHANSYLGFADGNSSTFPVYKMIRQDVILWCNARSEMEGRKPAYYKDNAHTVVYKNGFQKLPDAYVDWTSNGYRLPTEAEWEKAARGGLRGYDYPTGNTTSPSTANTGISGIGKTVAVGSYPPNAFGLYDMEGNVREFVWDGYTSDWYSKSQSMYPDPLGATVGSRPEVVLRGGAYNSPNSRIYIREKYVWDGKNNNFTSHGFRLVVSGERSPSMAKPTLTSDKNASGVVENPFSYSIEAVNSPTYFGATALPPGLSVNTATGQISGATTQAGSFVVNLTAGNPNGQTTQSALFSFRPVTPSRYVVVDLSGGSSASSYPVDYIDHLPSDFESNASRYKTTHLLLRYVNPGTFTMGDLNGSGASDEKPSRQVTLTKGFWLGVYEVTGAQYQAITGNLPQESTSGALPANYLSWNTIRGGSWPEGDRLPAENSFIAKLRTKTGINSFDLPTEAQWEYACRAGTATKWFWGNNQYATDNFAWHSASAGSQYREVGVKVPNNWGFYDMAGNVPEWVLDRYGAYLTTPESDPQGLNQGTSRVIRGGSRVNNMTLRSADRFKNTPNAISGHHSDYYGFRIALGANEYTPLINKFPPVVLAPKLLKSQVGIGFTYQIETESNATSFSVSGLPHGLELNSTNGKISGSPTLAGSFISEINATNSAGTSSAFIPFIIWPENNQTYAIIDLTGGASSAHYDVSFSIQLPNDWNGSTFKSDKILLKRVNPGTFTMGDMNGSGASDEKPIRQVTLTKPYYLGIYEVTGDQYQAITGNLPQESTSGALPANYLSWNTIRGGSWPEGDRLPAENSFIAKLRTKTGINSFDLPTEAQWEYACRAGTTTKWFWGNDQYATDNYAWKSGGQYREVGIKLPNNWGFYDMAGNVSEWVLDRYGAYLSVAETDPTGINQGGSRITRGGFYQSSVDALSSSRRNSRQPHTSAAYSDRFGFRLTLVVE